MPTTEEERPSRAATLPLVGNALCLDFANTSSGRDTPLRQEHLQRWENLLAWAEHVGLVDGERRHALERRDGGGEVLRRALELREAIHSLFRTVVAAAEAPAPALRALNRALSASMAAAQIHPCDDRFAWDWATDDAGPLQILGPIARSAAELLTGPDLQRVKLCAGQGCGWLFLDKTRNGRRRWCEMEVCGSRAKMRRYHQRRRDAAGGRP